MSSGLWELLCAEYQLGESFNQELTYRKQLFECVTLRPRYENPAHVGHTINRIQDQLYFVLNRLTPKNTKL